MITGGTGSGDVNEAYSVSLVEGLKAAGFGVDGALAEAYDGYLQEEQKKRPAPPRPFLAPPPIPERPVPADEIERLARETDGARDHRPAGEGRDRQREDDRAGARRRLCPDGEGPTRRRRRSSSFSTSAG
jgi:beta-glucosidase